MDYNTLVNLDFGMEAPSHPPQDSGRADLELFEHFEEFCDAVTSEIADMSARFRSMASRVAALGNVDVADPDDLHRALGLLEDVESGFWRFMDLDALDHGDDVRAVMDIYRRHLYLVRRWEGVDFDAAHQSLKVLLRLLPFVLGMLHNHFAFFDRSLAMPSNLSNLAGR